MSRETSTISWMVSSESTCSSELGLHHHGLELRCCTSVPNTQSCHSCAWQGHPAVLLPRCPLGTSAQRGRSRHPAQLLLPLEVVTSGAAGAGERARTCQQMAMFLCSAYLCSWLLFSPQPTAKPRREEQDPPMGSNHHPTQKIQSSEAQ